MYLKVLVPFYQVLFVLISRLNS